MKSIIRKLLSTLSRQDKPYTTVYKDIDADFFSVYEICKPYTMTSIERMYALYKATEYVVRNRIAGDFVECGVWKGGSAMLIAATLHQLKYYDKNIYLYDTFEGTSEPTEKDRNHAGIEASKLLAEAAHNKKSCNIWAYSTLDEVKQNLAIINYPGENIVYVKGKVEDTVNASSHNKIALLRLDTDWYESTYHEMQCLYPALEKNGILIIDDYGHWQGAREAVNQYCEENGLNILLNRIDYTGRIAVKN